MYSKMNIFTTLFGKRTQFTPIVSIRNFAKNDPPKSIAQAEVLHVIISPEDIALPAHDYHERKRLRKSPAVRKRNK
jgi:hypothetical protein